MAYSLNGIGTTFYGERDFRSDYSYVTTEWIVFLYIPLIPIRSLRVIPTATRPDSDSFRIGFGETKSYRILEKTPPNWKQVLYTYVFFLGFPSWVFFLAFCLSVAPSLQSLTGLILLFALSIPPAFLPQLLQRRAEKKVGIF